MPYIPHKSNAQVMRPTAAEIDRRRRIIKELRRAHSIATQTALTASAPVRPPHKVVQGHVKVVRQSDSKLQRRATLPGLHLADLMHRNAQLFGQCGL